MGWTTSTTKFCEGTLSKPLTMAWDDCPTASPEGGAEHAPESPAAKKRKAGLAKRRRRSIERIEGCRPPDRIQGNVGRTPFRGVPRPRVHARVAPPLPDDLPGRK